MFKDHPFFLCPLSSTLQLSDYFQPLDRRTESAEGVIIIKNVNHEAITTEEVRRGIDLSDGFCLQFWHKRSGPLCPLSTGLSNSIAFKAALKVQSVPTN